MALATEILSDRWTLLILREAFYGVKRYDDMRSDLGIPRSVLTERLKRLVEFGIFIREPYREAGARTRYAYGLSQKGAELGLPILALMQWGDKHINQNEPAIEILDRKSGKRQFVALVGDDAKATKLADVRIAVL
ncbi:hypothetical protein NBRC116601_04070 [Cognatishimia sp. WU-CL00825]|uniref:winged helix-turn-helix transcriptional regulator n=1 Tax=Cognatishimia sp. WU-CL00825 TaxID=3127658 RepID=UPI0031041D00